MSRLSFSYERRELEKLVLRKRSAAARNNATDEKTRALYGSSSESQ